MELYKSNKDQKMIRLRDADFLNICLIEYIQRVKVHIGIDISDTFISKMAMEFQNILKIKNFVPDKIWFNNFKTVYDLSITPVQNLKKYNPPTSLNVHHIIEYCKDNEILTVGITEIDAVKQTRKEKTQLLMKALDEYIQRAQYHLNISMDEQHLLKVAQHLTNIIKIEDFYPNKQWLLLFKNQRDFAVPQGTIALRDIVPASMDLEKIIKYCIEHDPQAPSKSDEVNLAIICPNKAKTNKRRTIEKIVKKSEEKGIDKDIRKKIQFHPVENDICLSRLGSAVEPNTAGEVFIAIEEYNENIVIRKSKYVVQIDDEEEVEVNEENAKEKANTSLIENDIMEYKILVDPELKMPRATKEICEINKPARMPPDSLVLEEIMQDSRKKNYQKPEEDNEAINGKKTNEKETVQVNFKEEIPGEQNLISKVQIIRTFDNIKHKTYVAKIFNCSSQMVNTIISHRSSIMQSYKNSNNPNIIRMKEIDFLSNCVFVYIIRAKLYYKIAITDKLLYMMAEQFQSVLQIENFTPDKQWLKAFKCSYSRHTRMTRKHNTFKHKHPQPMGVLHIIDYCKNQLEIASIKSAECGELKIIRKEKLKLLMDALCEYTRRAECKNVSIKEEEILKITQDITHILAIHYFFLNSGWYSNFKKQFLLRRSIETTVDLTEVPPDSFDLEEIIKFCIKQNYMNPEKVRKAMRLNSNCVVSVQQNYLKGKRKAVCDKSVQDESSKRMLIELEQLNNIIDDGDGDGEYEIQLIEDKEDVRERLDETQIKEDIKKMHSLADSKSEKLLEHINEVVIQKAKDCDHPKMHETQLECSSMPSDELPKEINCNSDALNLLEALQNFALSKENYRAIGLLSNLENIIQRGFLDYKRKTELKAMEHEEMPKQVDTKEQALLVLKPLEVFATAKRQERILSLVNQLKSIFILS